MDHSPDQRLARMEENLLFVERTLESLSQQMAALDRAVDLLGRRVAGLELRAAEEVERRERNGGGERLAEQPPE